MAEFGLFLHVAGRQRDAKGLFDEICAEAQLAEAVGFSFCVVAEHHQSRDGHFGAPLIWCAGIAARTTRLKVGTGVLLLPLYHPVHVAEDAACVDVISNGRFFLGLGMGYQDGDFAAFEVPGNQKVSRMDEGIEVIRAAWTQEAFSFHGKRFNLDNVIIEPKPIQKPHPPIWIGAMNQQAVRRAALKGDVWVADPLHNLADLQSMAKVYRELRGETGLPARVALRRDVWVAPTMEQALAEYSPAVLSGARYLADRGVAPDLLVAGEDQRAAERGLRATAEERLVIGSPHDCIAQVQKYQKALGIDYFSLRFRHPGGPPHELVMRAIRTFGEEVIQKL